MTYLLRWSLHNYVMNILCWNPPLSGMLITGLYCSNRYRIILVYLLKFRGIQFNFIISDVSQIKVVFILRMFSFIDDVGKWWWQAWCEEGRREQEVLLTKHPLYFETMFQTIWGSRATLVSSFYLPSFSLMPIYRHRYILKKGC